MCVKNAFFLQQSSGGDVCVEILGFFWCANFSCGECVSKPELNLRIIFIPAGI